MSKALKEWGRNEVGMGTAMRTGQPDDKRVPLGPKTWEKEKASNLGWRHQHGGEEMLPLAPQPFLHPSTLIFLLATTTPLLPHGPEEPHSDLSSQSLSD